MSRATALAYRDHYYIESDIDVADFPTTRRILLVEDSKSDVLLIKRALSGASSGESFEFADVPRMADALELLDEAVFDLILLDLNLLDIDGAASVAAIHASAPNVPIIVHSGMNDPRLRQEALFCGAKHFLVKGRESPYSFKFMVENALQRLEM